MRQKTAGKRGVSPRTREKIVGAQACTGGPGNGGGAKALGSPASGQATVAQEFPPFDTPPIPTTHSPALPDEDTPILSNIPSFIPDVPLMGVPLPKIGGISRNELQACRQPSVKNAGRDAAGCVIPHERSEDVAKVVATYAAQGASENFICSIVNIRPGQLRRHYSQELQHGAEMANQMVASTALAMATSGESEQMTKFWLKARAKWRDGETAADAGGLLNIHIHAE